MGEQTGIAWTDHTHNPWRGCTKISSGCENCYAEVLAKRNPDVLGVWGNKGKRVSAAESYWNQPLSWNGKALRDGVRRSVFCGSLMDFFEDRPEVEQLRLRALGLMSKTKQLDWLLLTKRPGNIIPVLARAKLPDNVRLGTTVEDQMATSRVEKLLEAASRFKVGTFLSVEPLIGPVKLPRVADVGWVIVGCESGPNRRPCDPAWVRGIVDDCRAAGTPVFVKQMAVECDAPKNGVCHHLRHWPKGVRFQEKPRRSP